MKMKMKIPAFSLLASLVFSVPALNAAAIITPTGAVSSLGSLSSRPIGKTIDSSGLSGGGTSGNILAETHDDASSNSGPYFLGAKGSVLTFDLGSAFSVDTVHIWNYTRTGETDRAVQGFDISFSSDDVTYTTPVTVTGFSSIPYSGGVVVDVQSQSFTAGSGRYIKLENVTNHGDSGYTGFGEIRFSAVPEPSVALLGAVGLLALLRRRRN